MTDDKVSLPKKRESLNYAPMTRDQFISLFFLALLFFVIYQVFLILSPFKGPILWAAMLAFAFYPLYDKWKKRLNRHETVAAGTMTVFIFCIIIPPIIFLIVNITAQAIELYQMTSNYIREGRLEALIDQIRNISWVHQLETNAMSWEPIKKEITNYALVLSKGLANFSIVQAGAWTKNVFVIWFNIIFTAFLVFVFLKDGHKIHHFIYQIAPLDARTKSSIDHKINDTLSAVIRGQIFTAIAQASLTGIIFWFLGLPAPILFAAATFMTSLVPILGAAIIWFPFCLFLLSQQLYAKAIILFGLGVFLISLIDNLIKPAIIGEKTKLPYFLLLLGILGGMRLYGLMGIFLAPVILSLFFALAQIYQEKYLKA